MSLRSSLIVGVIWVASLAAVAAAARAQSPQPVPANPQILSGADIGFRVENTQGNVPTGTVVIRWNGKWVEPKFTQRPMRLTPLTQ